jgi:2-succinyl-6-hydroxy-2,4-cyclohexadiene-1-carboxylate synthase
MEHTINALTELLDHLKVQRVQWLGYSMGGRIAVSAAIMLPDRTLSLTVESGSAGLATDEERESRVRSDEALAGMVEEDGIGPFVSYWELLPLWASQARLPLDVRRAHRTQRLTNNPIGLANSLRGIGTGAQPPLHERLKDLRLPVLFIAGEEDDKFTAIAREMHRAVPGSQLSMIRDAGHAVHLEQPDMFNQTVLEFLRTVDSERSPQDRTRSLPNR